ncbi:MAG: glycine--tRNA ligase subunit beta [Limnohabitans sp.]|nr:glycine--tRNA ligase subunit beta [Limnohabitans sp.]
MTTSSLLVELFVEELPPKALQQLGQSFASVLFEQLQAQGLTTTASAVTPFASPRRLAAHVTAVLSRAEDRAVQHKLMPVKVGLDAQGQATPALLKKLQSLGADASVVPQLDRVSDGKAETLFLKGVAAGVTLAAGLQRALDESLSRLPIPKVMTYQPETDMPMPGWSSVQFVRPAHGLVALHGTQVVPVQALGLQAGAITHGHRFEALQDPITLTDADAYASSLANLGAVIASFADRRAEIVRQLDAAAQRVGGGVRPVDDPALLDEVTALVERPHVLVCEFEPAFLEVPQECLILTMKANQKYFPLLDAQGRLTHRFLVVSNIRPDDASAVIGGNERVVRPRLADARFFFDQDRKKTLASRVEGLAKVVYHNKLGTQAERSERVCAIANLIARQLPTTADESSLRRVQDVARLAKTDLLTDMVGEFPELQGIMGGYYARHDGLGDDVAQAIEDHYRPRFAGDDLPRNDLGLVAALADKLETLVGMFGIGNLPSGDKDPFALRRHALGVLRMLIERDLPLDIGPLLQSAFEVFGARITGDQANALQALTDFLSDRLAGLLREQGYSAQEIDAVLSLRPQRLGEVRRRLDAVRAFAALPQAAALAAANKRITNILKKADQVEGAVQAALLQEPAEQALHQVMSTLTPQADQQWARGDYTTSLQTLAALREPVDAFFEHVMVNAEQAELRRNRLVLLQQLHQAMNRVADLSRLAS